eukprot:1000718-Pyramimonas_sp.AAC.1
MICGQSRRNEPEAGAGATAGAAAASNLNKPVQDGAAVGAVPEADTTQEMFFLFAARVNPAPNDPRRAREEAVATAAK